MNELVARRVALNVAPKQRVAQLGPSVPIVKGDCLVRDEINAAPVIVQASLPEDETACIRRLLRARRASFMAPASGGAGNGRMSGLRHESAMFGYRPRTPLRRQDFCSATQMMADFPDTHAELDRLTGLIEFRLADLAPDVYAEQLTKVSAIRPDWRINRTSPWTSGVINNTAALAYHRDSNNVSGSWSAMLVLRRFIRGGLLHVPEYGVALACPDNGLVFFCGSDLIHGVTPFRRAAGFEGQAYRLTLVWYAINRMAQCLPVEEELAWARRHRTEREDRAGAR